jgi:hypothetical protein
VGFLVPRTKKILHPTNWVGFFDFQRKTALRCMLREITGETKTISQHLSAFWGNLGYTSVSIGDIIGTGIFFIIRIAADKACPAVILSLVLAHVMLVIG